MSGVSYIDNAIKKQLMDMNIVYLAKVLTVSGTTAKIQPLGMIKQVGETAEAKAPVSNVPIIRSAQPLAVGDIVVCVCADRDITEARNGKNALPQVGMHSISDSIIIGVL